MPVNHYSFEVFYDFPLTPLILSDCNFMKTVQFEKLQQNSFPADALHVRCFSPKFYVYNTIFKKITCTSSLNSHHEIFIATRLLFNPIIILITFPIIASIILIKISFLFKHALYLKYYYILPKYIIILPMTI